MDKKPFKTFEEQLTILKSRNLKFLDEESAIKILSTFGYYEIVNGYKDSILDKNSEPEKFIDGATFEQLFSLFRMDKIISEAVSETMHALELHLRTAFSYTIAELYSSDVTVYLTRENYERGNDKFKKQSERSQLLYKLEKIKRDKTQPFKHYREIHGNIPPWILLKGTTFGNLITFYRLQKQHVKTSVIHMVTGIPKELITTDIKNMFIEILYMLLAYRNRADHGGRMYNFKSTKGAMKYHQPFHDRMKITEDDFKLGKGKTGLETLIAGVSWFSTYAEPWLTLNNQITFAIHKHLDKYPDDKDFVELEIGAKFIPIA